MMSDVYIPAAIRIRGEHAGFPLSGEHPDFEFTCHRKDVVTSFDGKDIVYVTPVMLLTAQGRGQTFVVCGDAGKEVYAEMGEQLRGFQR